MWTFLALYFWTCPSKRHCRKGAIQLESWHIYNVTLMEYHTNVYNNASIRLQHIMEHRNHTTHTLHIHVDMIFTQWWSQFTSQNCGSKAENHSKWLERCWSLVGCGLRILWPMTDPWDERYNNIYLYENHKKINHSCRPVPWMRHGISYWWKDRTESTEVKATKPSLAGWFTLWVWLLFFSSGRFLRWWPQCVLYPYVWRTFIIV